LRVIREAIYFKPQGTGTDIPLSIEYLNRVTRRSAITFIISDFYAEGLKNPLSIANKRHDVVAINIIDPRDVSMPNVGIVKLKDAETEKEYLLDTADPKVREDYQLKAGKKNKRTQKAFYSVNIDSIDISTDKPYTKALIEFFKKKEK